MRVNYSAVIFTIILLAHVFAIYSLSHLAAAAKPEPQVVLMKAITLPPPPKIEKPPVPEKKPEPPKKVPVPKIKPQLPPPVPTPVVANDNSLVQQASTEPVEPSAPVAEYVEPEPPITAPQVDAKRPNKSPPYPHESRRFKEEGSVILEILILANGTVGEVRIKTSSGFPRLDKAAIQNAKKWHFLPATQGGKPISYWNLQSVKFVMN